jgi:hypothetical protein
MFRRPLALLALTLLLNGCASIELTGQNDLLDQTKTWGKLVKWGEYGVACQTLAAPEVQQQCLDGFVGEGLTMVGITVKDVKFDGTMTGATVILTSEYFREPAVTLKKVTQQQRWEVRDKRWLLTEPSPPLP